MRHYRVQCDSSFSCPFPRAPKCAAVGTGLNPVHVDDDHGHRLRTNEERLHRLEGAIALAWHHVELILASVGDDQIELSVLVHIGQRDRARLGCRLDRR